MEDHNKEASCHQGHVVMYARLYKPIVLLLVITRDFQPESDVKCAHVPCIV